MLSGLEKKNTPYVFYRLSRWIYHLLTFWSFMLLLVNTMSAVVWGCFGYSDLINQDCLDHILFTKEAWDMNYFKEQKCVSHTTCPVRSQYDSTIRQRELVGSSSLSRAESHHKRPASLEEHRSFTLPPSELCTKISRILSTQRQMSPPTALGVGKTYPTTKMQRTKYASIIVMLILVIY